MSTETDTPRTDEGIDDARNVALDYECSPSPDPKQCEVVHADFARSLECELNEARQQRDRLAEALRKYEDALADGPENCSWMQYEECHNQARAALAEVEGKEGV